MSINVYLKQGLETMEGFKKEGPKPGANYNTQYFRGVGVYEDKGRYYVTLSYLTDTVSEILGDVIEEVSFRECIPAKPKRTIGAYKHKTATAELDVLGQGGKDERYFMKLNAGNLEDARELYQLIRAGTIAPTESWETEQKISKKRWSLWDYFVTPPQKA